LKLILHWLRGNRWIELFKPGIHLSIENNQAKITIQGALTFVTFVRLKHLIQHARTMNKTVILDLTETHFIDHTMLSKIENFKTQFEENEFIICGDEGLQSVYHHQLSIKTMKTK
jgi:MFS superfamily sulfate permease-like transporter